MPQSKRKELTRAKSKAWFLRMHPRNKIERQDNLIFYVENSQSLLCVRHGYCKFVNAHHPDFDFLVNGSQH